MSRLSIEIEPEQHRQIKTLATFAGMTMKEFILSRTLSPKRDETEALMASDENAERLRKAIATPDREHLRFESLKDLEDALGI